MNKSSIMLAWLGGIAVALFMSGCKCCCPFPRPESGVATIFEQPEDVVVAQGETADFEVEALGKDLSYQWFFTGGALVEGTTGSRSDHLVIPNVSTNVLGGYWCEIDSVNPKWGTPERTRTRMATLSMPRMAAASTTNIPPTSGT